MITTKRLGILLHTIAWVLIFTMPVLIFGRNDNDVWFHYSTYLITPLSFMITFYLNYTLLIKKYLFEGKIKNFIIINIILLTLLSGASYTWYNYRWEVMDERIEQQEQLAAQSTQNTETAPLSPQNGDQQAQVAPQKTIKRNRTKRRWWHIVTDIFSLTCMCAFAIAVKSTINWYKTEDKRKELEKNNVENELKNLKSQLNPHFLFNTLNNIYALIAISPDKSQEAVKDLSQMLRYVLYEDSHETTITQESNFINNYVKLMKLRLQPNVTVDLRTDISAHPDLRIAPLLFISLIENAFKHGVDSTQDSFIRFSLEVTPDKRVICHQENSYFPKEEAHDRSGSGIGIENLHRRLELIYPHRHTFTMNVVDNTYISDLNIDLSE